MIGQKKILEMIEPCMIVSSEESSSGKSFYIQNACKSINKNPKYLFLAGLIQ